MEKLKAMMVEDSPDCAALLNHILIQSKMFGEIQNFMNGEDALEHLETDFPAGDAGHLPDLIFLDLNLPGEHGLETLVKIKKHPLLHRIPVIVMTASEERSDFMDTYKKGGTVFVRKPLNQEMLTEVLMHMKMTGVFKAKK